MKEKRSIFELFFGKKKRPVQQQAPLQMLSGMTSPFLATASTEAYENDVYRSAVDAIARNAAKMSAKHIKRVDGKINDVKNSSINLILSQSPNKYMGAYAFYYKIFTQLFVTNNAFIFVDWSNDYTLKGLYPIDSTSLEFKESNGEIFVQFMFLSGQKLTVPYNEVIHLRRFFYKNDLTGERSTAAIQPALMMLDTTNDGLINAIKSSAYIRGLVKYNHMAALDDIKEQINNFTSNYLTIANNGGVLALDSRADYVPLNNDPRIVDSNQMTFIENKIYSYLGISKQIVQGDWNEDQGNAFYESTLEPLAVQMTQEFTRKLFTDRERAFGNEIVFQTNRIQVTSYKTKKEFIEIAAPLGLLTINEAREIWNLPPIEEGEKRLISLNYVDASMQNEYQLGKNAANKKNSKEEINGDKEDESEDEVEDDKNDDANGN